MGVMVYSLLWVMQDLYHQPYHQRLPLPLLSNVFGKKGVSSRVSGSEVFELIWVWSRVQSLGLARPKSNLGIKRVPFLV